MQKENLFFFSFPSESNFGIAKVTKKACKKKAILEDSLQAKRPFRPSERNSA
jgi:hypothetical protein